MKKIMFVLIFCAAVSCRIKDKCKRENVKNICEVTKYGLSVYISLRDEKNQKYLMTTQNLYFAQFQNTQLNGNYIDSLKLILLNKNWRLKSHSEDLINSFVDSNLYNSIAQKEPLEVYSKYIGSNFCPKWDKYPENEIRAAVCYMVDNCALVNMSQPSAYVFYKRPISKCINCNKNK